MLYHLSFQGGMIIVAQHIYLFAILLKFFLHKNILGDVYFLNILPHHPYLDAYAVNIQLVQMLFLLRLFL